MYPFRIRQVIAALLRHLGFLCNRDLFTDIEWSESEPFWITVCNSLSAITSLPSLLWILWSFLDGHVDNDEGFVTALGSEYGGRVIYVLLSRAYAICAAASPPPDPQQISEESCMMKCETRKKCGEELTRKNHAPDRKSVV